MTEISKSADTKHNKYEDIINMPHHVSEKHPQMSRHDRAAQFSPFAALTGYEEAIDETARLTDKRIELDENSKSELDMRLASLCMQLEKRPPITITYFKPDEVKEGGRYVTVSGRLKGTSNVDNSIILEDGSRYMLEDIIDIESEFLR